MAQFPNSSGLAVVQADLRRFESNSKLTANVREHYEHLERLASNLRKLGMDMETIDMHVVALFHEYKAELAKVVEARSAGERTQRIE